LYFSSHGEYLPTYLVFSSSLTHDLLTIGPPWGWSHDNQSGGDGTFALKDPAKVQWPFDNHKAKWWCHGNQGNGQLGSTSCCLFYFILFYFYFIIFPPISFAVLKINKLGTFLEKFFLIV